MNIEEEIFKRSKVKQEDTLLSYGFTKNNNEYNYSINFMNDFRADITIDENGKVKGRVYDLNVNDEYLNLRTESQVGEFVNHVREEYKNILNDIRLNCFETSFFITNQANRISSKIKELYQDDPEFLWDKFPGYGVFRNHQNQKWYSVILNIDKNKLDKECHGEVEVINLKVHPDDMSSLLKKEGIYSGYHMNKKSWITIVLDETLKDEEIINYLVTSYIYSYTNKKIEFKKISEFPKNTLYNQLVDAYSFDSNCQKNWNNMWQEYDDFFYANLNNIADKYGFITVLNGKPIGHISWDPRNKPNYVIIGHNCILTKYKGKGYGKIQLSEAIRRIKEEKVNKIIVTTNEITIPAQKNYESVGFTKVGERPNNETPFAGKYLDYELIINNE